MRFLIIPLALVAGSAGAAVFSVTDNTGGAIPDGSSSGLARSLIVSAPGETILSLEVTLNLGPAGGGPAFLGDLYLYLTNGTESAVLLNRPGRSAAMPSGYSDNQLMVITFTSGTAEDIHNYRVPVTGSPASPLTSTLTGTWEADGREVDPGIVLDTDPRTAGLGVFAGNQASGSWSLFAADLSTGAAHRINSWGITLTTIPEPSGSSLVLVGLLAVSRRKRKPVPG